MNQLYDQGRQDFLDALIDAPTDDIRAVLIASTYTFSAAHTSMTDIGANDNGRSAALASKTITAGVFDAADTSITAIAAVASNAIGIFKHTGTDATARLIAYIDNKFRVEIAADAASSATTIIPENMPEAIASGAVLTKISGTGPATVTTTASGAQGVRTLSVTALASNIVAGAVYEYQSSSFVGLPFTPAASQVVNITWSNGADRIFKL